MDIQEQIELSISSQKIFSSGDIKILKVTLTNRSDTNLLILKWYTPFEGLLSNCLEIKFNQESIFYDGPLFKRGNPGLDDFVLLSSGESISTEVNLGQSYQVSHPGEYEVSYRSEIWGYIVSDLTVRLSDLIVSGSELPLSLQVSPSIQFTVVENEVRQLTLGEAARLSDRKNLTLPDESILTVDGQIQPPSFQGGTPEQQAKTQLAHTAGYGLAVDALKQLKDDPQYQEWFGQYVDSRFYIVKEIYEKVVDRMNSTRFTYNLTGSGCGANTLAYTYKGSSTIWMCSKFWQAPDLGTDSKAGTVVHEHSHASAGTDDITYGQQQCRDLARKDPTYAVQNADNYEYYCGG